MIPDSGGTFILPRIVGLQRAAALTMLGDKMTRASRRREWGLVYMVVPSPSSARDERRASRKRLADACRRARSASPSAASTQSLGVDLEAQLDSRKSCSAKRAGRDDYAEGVHAFLEKRKPVFKGR